jgi:predicted tellurium resistance membrane protein TerC
MELLLEPQAWLSFGTLAVLEIILGIDNIIFLTILVDRLPQRQRRSARVLGLGFAMLTRIALLFSITWFATLRVPLATVGNLPISGRGLILCAGGLFLIAKSAAELSGMRRTRHAERKPGGAKSFWVVVAQVGVIDVVFSLDSVFTAVGLARDIAIMIAAIATAVFIMMWVAGMVSEFIARHPRIKVLSLAFLLLIGAALIAEAFEWAFPKAYLYFALGFSAGVEWLNVRVFRRQPRAPDSGAGRR